MATMDRIWIGALSLGLVLSVAGCAKDPEPMPKPEPKGAVSSASPSGAPAPSAGAAMPKSPMAKLSETVAVGKPAPDFAIKDEKGQEWHLSDYKGKTILLDFWAFW